MFQQRAIIPVEQRSYAVYYLAFSGLLLLGTVWAVWDEVRVRRPWKEYQEGYYALLASKFDSLKQVAQEDIDPERMKELSEELATAQNALQSKEYQDAMQTKNGQLAELDIATREWRFARSRSDASYYAYKKSIQDGKEDKDLKTDVDGHDADIAKYFAMMNELNAKIAVQNQVIDKYVSAIERITAEITSLEIAVEGLALKSRNAKSAPIAIRQVVLNDFEFTPFAEIKARVDRCQTCHTGWNEPTMEDAPQPYRKHPIPELLAKHNPEFFGCTPCHRGQGPALTEGFAHGDKDHYWETPLLRGVDIYTNCNACHTKETSLPFAKPFVKAKQLVLENGCYGCHEIRGYSETAKIGPQLNSLPQKVSGDWLYRWLKSPREYNPHTRMPDFRLSDTEAEAIATYLFKVGSESKYTTIRSRGTVGGGSISEGKRIFENVGCQACHVIGNELSVREERGSSYDIAPELTRVGSKVSPDWMFDWLKNPRHFNPETRMPNLRLSDDEVRNLVAYLMTLKDDPSQKALSLNVNDAEKVARGDKLIREYGCAGCHTIKGMENEGKVSVNLSDFGRKKYEQMDYGDTDILPKSASVDYAESTDGVGVKRTWAGWVYGKMKNARLYQTERIDQKMPVFNFNDEEIRLLRMFLLSMTRDLPLAQHQRTFDRRLQEMEEGRSLVLHYNCLQCHSMEDRGGYLLAKYDEKALGPPIIPESQGAKVQEAWLHDFLKKPTTIRPWLQVRMPTFDMTDAEVTKIQKYFLGLSKQELVIRNYAETPVDATYLAAGKKLFDSYQCAMCHPTGPVRLDEGRSASDLAPNLAMASKRLKPEWIIDWLENPTKLQPGTRMPTYFYDGQSPDQTVFGGNATEQIKALKTYVWSIGGRAGLMSARDK